MTGNLAGLVFEAERPRETAAFWAGLLGPAGGGLLLHFVPPRQPKRGKNRVHLDLASVSAEHQADLIKQARDLGAGLPQQPAGVPWTVLTDPCGNEFCVLEPREDYHDTLPLALSSFGRRSGPLSRRLPSSPSAAERPLGSSVQTPTGPTGAARLSRGQLCVDPIGTEYVLFPRDLPGFASS
ncbi:VOC family protein [Amycolatopsis suaedae]|uniref:Glyoxalase-like domain-containing protein n=1 Tax=Amycolatopsis suaedae TaxID=2510978 RepID=A0A4Q7J0S4_9PSEU|nr:VOC family protein [Amycolatopsis suaedae]RZQ59973.1 hypothetical protein EWH70_31585 [Amycolatopsis suaedae]